MARLSSKDIVIKITDTGTVGGGDSLIDHSASFLNFPQLNKEYLTEAQIPFSATVEEHHDVGVARVADVSVEVDVNTTAATLYRILQNAADNRVTLTLKTIIGTTPTARYRQMDVIVVNDSETGQGGAITKGSFTLRNAGNYSAGIE